MIISGFAGIGKTTFTSMHSDIAIDLESSNFKWIFDESIKDINVEERKGLTEKVPNPEWPMNYIKAIKEASKKYAYVFICMDADIREILRQENIRYFVAFPMLECKDEYIGRYRERNNGENFIRLLEAKYDTWVSDLIETEPNQIRLTKGQYISDKLGERD